MKVWIKKRSKFKKYYIFSCIFYICLFFKLKRLRENIYAHVIVTKDHLNFRFISLSLRDIFMFTRFIWNSFFLSESERENGWINYSLKYTYITYIYATMLIFFLLNILCFSFICLRNEKLPVRELLRALSWWSMFMLKSEL
jgi:hypothetical protein